MKEFTKAELAELLLDNYDYPENEIDATIEQLRNMTEIGKRALEELITTQYLPNIEFQGLSLKEMKQQKPDYSDIALIIVFDGFVRCNSNMRT